MKTWLAALIMGVALSATALSDMALAAIEAHEFASDAELARYRHLADILRCPKCQNQNIAESNSPIAADLRAEVRRMLAAGHSDQQIIQFMVERYGDFVLYQPPFDVRTILDRKSTRLNSSHVKISYAVFCLKKKNEDPDTRLIVFIH